MTIKITYDQALLGLKRAVMEKGADYVYTPLKQEDEDGRVSEECAYFDGDKPGCIVGHVISYYGVTPEMLVPQSLNAGMGVDLLTSNRIIELDEPAYMLLSLAQETQDMGRTWGLSVERAIAYVDHHLASDAG